MVQNKVVRFFMAHSVLSPEIYTRLITVCL